MFSITLREREGISRAEIARETKLQRSTVSAIVEELKGEGLVEEVAKGESTGGRRPRMLKLRAAGADRHGCSNRPHPRITVASSDLAGRLIDQEEFVTDPDLSKTLSRVIDCVREFSRRNGGSIDGVGLCLPGLVDPASGHFALRAVFSVARCSGDAVDFECCRTPSGN